MVAFDKLADDVTKGGERQVNLSCLLKPITCGMRLTLPLRTSQIDQVDDGEFFNFPSIFKVNLFELNSNNCMGSTRGLVHESRSNRSIIITLISLSSDHFI